MATPKQTDPQFKLRLTAALKRQIEDAAKVNNRSMNAEIVARLEGSFSGRAERVDRQNEVLSDRLERIERQLQRMTASVSKEIDRQRSIRANPKGLSPEAVASLEGAETYRSDPSKPYQNPYPEDDLRHHNFRSGFRNAVRHHLLDDEEARRRFPEVFSPQRPDNK